MGTRVRISPMFLGVASLFFASNVQPTAVFCCNISSMMVVSEIVNHSFCIPISSNFFYCKSRDELLRKDYNKLKNLLWRVYKKREEAKRFALSPFELLELIL
jgi:hypothetical protein